MVRYLKDKANISIITVSSLLAISLFGDSLLYNVLPLYAEDLKIPLTAVGLLLSMNRWVRLLSNPLSYKVFAKYGLTKPLILFTIVGIISTFFYAQSYGLLFFLAARTLWGITWSHLRLGAYLIIQGASKKGLGLSMGIMGALTRLGSSFTVFFGGFLIDRLGYRQGMLIMASLSTLAIPVVLYLTRLVKNEGGLLEKREDEVEKGAMDSTAHPLFSKKICNLYHFINMFITGFTIASLSLILRERLGSEAFFLGHNLGIATMTGLLLSIQYSSNLLLAPLAGYLSDQWGRYRSFLSIVIMRVIALFFFASIKHPLITILMVLMVFFAGNSLKIILEAAMVGISKKEEGGGAMSAFASFEDLGLASGPLLGYILGVYLTFDTIYFICAMGMGAPLLGAHLLQKRYAFSAQKRGRNL